MKEIRVTGLRAESPAGQESLTLQGRPIVFETPTVIHDPAGEYIEIIKSGALDNTDLSDVRLLYNHDLSKVPLARTPKTMQLQKGPAGLEMRALLADTQEAKAVHEAVKRGDLSGMSFAFTVPQGGDEWDAATNTRTINQIAKVLECSITPFPAYPTASVEARSARQDVINRNQAKQKAKILFNQIMKVQV